MKFNKELGIKYDHSLVEKNKYNFWLEQELFKANPKSTKPKFSIILPPPNVTGKLHIGHAWDGAIQDAMIRFKRLNGYEVLFVPGMDHSGISTQVKVEEQLRQQGISKIQLVREGFLKHAWKWKEEYATIIRQQWAKLGLSLDYSIEAFTLDPKINHLVKDIFIKFYEQKIIYKDKQIVNWDPIQRTAISNVEVIFKEIEGAMYYFKYQLENSDEFLEVATTRPETMFANQCLVINPKDERYQKYINKNVISPINMQIIPIIADEYVEMDFGTGVMKCTPAHDVNDFAIGKRHNLDLIVCLAPDGKINQIGGKYEGLDRFDARKKIVSNLKDEGLLIKIEPIKHQVGFSERSNAIVEPYLSDQWFVKMDKFGEMILDLQKSSDSIAFFPERFNDVLTKWMESAYDWTISRQLWWGHQIPAWYHKTNNEIFVGHEPPSDIENWAQDEDVLDTWFSSGLWAFSPLLNAGKEYFDAFFPIDVLVTGYDIIFFWVARMIFQTLEYTGSKPFRNVLIHGLVRDEQGRKMSKSLGNGIDPMDVIETNGSDALRLFLLTNSTPGQDLRYVQEKVNASWNFINKLWNASRYVFLNLSDDFVYDENNLKLELNFVDQWILTEITKIKSQINKLLDNFEFGIAGKLIYDFVWTKFCKWYIEFSKVSLQKEETKLQTQTTLYYILKEILILLHPFLPFVTEEIYQCMNIKKSILNEQQSKLKFEFEVEYINKIIELISSIREFRTNNEIKMVTLLEFKLSGLSNENKVIFFKYINEINQFLKRFVNSKIIEHITTDKTKLINVEDYFLEIENCLFIDENKVKNELKQKHIQLTKEIERSNGLLNNENFLNRASEEKILEEKIKYQKYKEQLNAVETKLDELKG